MSVAAAVTLAGLLTTVGHARPSVGRAGGGGGAPRPAGGMSRPAAASRPQMARPNVPGPQMASRPAMPAAQMPQFQRPSVGSAQRPNLSRPSLPNAGGMSRPALPSPQMPRPGLGTTRPGGTLMTGRPGVPSGVGTLPGAAAGGMTRPGGAVGLPGMGGAASRPGGGFATRPAPLPGLGSTRPAPGASPLGRPSLGATTRPSFPQPQGPGGSRPGLGNRPTTLPGNLGGGSASANRPTTLPGTIGTRPGGNAGLPGGERPGIGGNRPGIGGNRPTTLPGDISGGGLVGNRPGIGGNRPGFGGNWPGIGSDRPGIGGNRPGLGDGNNVWNNGNLISGNNLNNVNINGGWGFGGGWGAGGGWGYPGYGGWSGGWHGGCVNPHYGWYNGCWNGNWGNYGGGWWAPFALGAASWGLLSTVSNWGLGYASYGYDTGAYINPYYAAMPAAVVAASPYDYAQPVMVNNYVTNDGDLSTAHEAQGGAGGTATANNAVDAVVDEALAKFKDGDYPAALSSFDKALRLSPGDSVIHEARALALFALGRYQEAAAALNAVLASAPGMDWTTVSNLYGSVDAYTAQLRKLEDFCRAHADDPAAHFLLAYHYLVGGHADMAARELKVVIAKQPGDMVAKRLLEAVAPAAETPSEAATPPAPAAAAVPAVPSVPETDLVGAWKAVGGQDTVSLTITEDSQFTWKAEPQGKPAVVLSGTVETAADAIAMHSEKAGTMVGKVTSKGPDAFEFSLPGAPKEAKPLLFERQK